MADILIPHIDSVTINPNPVNQNTSFLIAIAVSEVYQTPISIIIYSGTIKSGENMDGPY